MSEILSIIKDNKNKSSIKVNINCNLNRKYDFEMRIVLILLDDVMKNENNENNFNKRKEFIEKLESVVNCIRFELMDFKDIFKENKDNLDIVMTFKSSTKLDDEFENLIKKYLEYKKCDYFNVSIVNLESRGEANGSNVVTNSIISNLKNNYSFINFDEK
ncbi:hypothetical protein [Clostridium neonatale]|uniref:hypothetical protein n=1 Tax=Clostridium neonatale TaxID=137838 RepID=UPI00291B4065|nr:hypothetical protein [Clostridium neonatale]CAI3212445.1 hypothetical protein CNEO2_590004 [Clostridium neonatale]CAI3561494.1 hypothetical protein CNEO4_120090 [Clostridium neonatale]CAI3614736.1 hypothetical protein CNEO4_210040 [Clostridium neonatale]CAI3636555.1 hypothetical protein CNEO2_180142 [Clostridium neonatale]CAI3636578.1 hypothetical protein CNEO4_220129 [Clostridium neonatale]